MIIGAPVRMRDWVLPIWHKHVLTACEVAEVEPEFLFVVGRDDTSTRRIIEQWCEPILVDEPIRDDIRDWHTERFTHMANLRNDLLRGVRERRPDFFLSLDTDILLHPNALKSMLDIYSEYKSKGCWAVGGKTHMTHAGSAFPSFGFWKDAHNPSKGIRRQSAFAVQIVDVIMAIKLMSPDAYNVKYSFHHWGEDLGWCANVRLAGGKFWWDGSISNKHIMEPWMLDRVDKRCGF